MNSQKRKKSKIYNKNKLAYGVGKNDNNEKVKIDGRMIPSYDCWMHMLTRCYSQKFQAKRPTYIECSVCTEWLLFSNFKEWYTDNYVKGFQLDNDILKKGNRIYSPETCRFVPQYLNTLLNDCNNSRGDLPLGVHTNKNSYEGFCKNGYGKNVTKTFKTISEAQNWYSITKKRIVKEQTVRAFDENAILSDVACALLEREW